MNHSPLPQTTVTPLGNIMLFAGGTLAAAAAAWSAALGRHWFSVPACALCTLAALACFRQLFTQKRPPKNELCHHLLAAILLALAVDPQMVIWQVPKVWPEVLRITSLTGGFLILCLVLNTLRHTMTSADTPHPLETLALLVSPVLFNSLLMLSTPDQVAKLGAWWGASGLCALILGRTIILGLFNEVVGQLLSLLIIRRPIREFRLHALLIGAALLAAISPECALLGSSASLASWPKLAAIPAAIGASMLSQAGLWAQTFLLTGLIMDVFHHKKPTAYWGERHFWSGLGKGAVYALLFLGLIQVMALFVQVPLLKSILTFCPIPCAAVLGALSFPFFQTIVESFDGSEAFHRRVRRNYRDWSGMARGAVVGVGIALAVLVRLPSASSFGRFLFGAIVGIAAYAGVNLLRDLLRIRRKERSNLQTWRLYALGAILGGCAGGGLAWYVDAAQIQVLVAKFFKYTALFYPQAGMAVEDYVIYPLFSKWGAVNLGASPGAVRLFYNEALSGVINWSLAAPLFSVNIVLLNSLLQRSLAPLKGLFTRDGIIGVVEQTLRVLRWGLWMAPVIYSFLRMSPDPTWYNQDGAIRTVMATVQAWLLEPSAYRAWSLDLFLKMMTYDWLRILIWVDHMGLRVATLVNLSFVGFDILDEKAAHALGCSARTRCIPEGIRRFATWAPLLIPFYLPRGADWSYVWDTSAARAAELAATSWPPINYLLAAFIFLMALTGLTLALRRRAKTSVSAPSPALAPPACHLLGNGRYTVEISENGCGYSRVFSGVRKGFELDLTRRPDDPLQWRGKFFYVTEKGKKDWWAASPGPSKTTVDTICTRPDPLTIVFERSHNGLRVISTVSLNPDQTLEYRSLRFINLEDRPRSLELASYQEFGLNNTDAYRRAPFYNFLHIGVRFNRPFTALLAQNRLNKTDHEDPTLRKMSGETAFHAIIPGEGITLLGYDDSRTDFLGRATALSPDALNRPPAHSPCDETLHYTFDPAASLRLGVELEAHGVREVRFVDGYAASEAEAMAELGKLRHPAPEAAGSTDNEQPLPQKPVPEPARQLFSFSSSGDELTLSDKTPRPWHHIMANPLGYGLMVANDGSASSFMQNGQQNGITPCDTDSVCSQLPGQVFYIHDMDRNETTTPGFVPLRQAGDFQNTWGVGYAIQQHETEKARIALTRFVLPDEPAELLLLKLENRSAEPARYRLTPYFQLLLGETPVDTRSRLITEKRGDLLLASNPANDFWKGWAFAAATFRVSAMETVRARFLGGHDLENPVMVTTGLSAQNAPDDGFRCFALSGEVSIPPGKTIEVGVLLGQTATPEEAEKLARAFSSVEAMRQALEKTRAWWRAMLEKGQVASGDKAVDRLLNIWLPYQVLVAHLWGRIGPYQRGGAFGFRDQLQSVLALTHTHPEIARSQILLNAAQQFPEGDVLHWWHLSWEGKTGIGMRGNASDPHLWLPYVVCQYLEDTNDYGILDECSHFLEAPAGAAVVASRPSRDTATLYEHCVRAIELALRRYGPHELPLLGAGDWNDGLDTAGFKGRGESGWMGFFLYGILNSFAKVADRRGDNERARAYREKAARLKEALEHIWRGDHYVRLITDDGRESNRNDALMAAWPILSGAVDAVRGREIMAAALSTLERDRLVQLFDPPYTENDDLYPGRLADYPPGVRENGGQYTHGVSWLVDALLVLEQSCNNASQAAHDHQRAVDLWRKISPLAHTDDPEDMQVYGLPPHQQTADIYYAPAYKGRGGWSWYTGAAARMLYVGRKLFGTRR